MKLKEKKQLQQAFTFSAADIDTAADFVMDSLTELGLPGKDALRTRLSVEEVLLNWQSAQGLQDTYTVSVSRRFGRILLTL